MDPIADMLTRIRNANSVKNSTVMVSSSRLTQAVADILLREGWIRGVAKQTKKTRKMLDITLEHTGNISRITGIRRVSSPGKRIYKGWRELHSVKQGYGIAVVSTPKGLLTDKEARKQKAGGEVLFEIW